MGKTIGISDLASLKRSSRLNMSNIVWTALSTEPFSRFREEVFWYLAKGCTKVKQIHSTLSNISVQLREDNPVRSGYASWA